MEGSHPRLQTELVLAGLAFFVAVDLVHWWLKGSVAELSGPLNHLLGGVLAIGPITVVAGVLFLWSLWMSRVVRPENSRTALGLAFLLVVEVLTQVVHGPSWLSSLVAVALGILTQFAAGGLSTTGRWVGSAAALAWLTLGLTFGSGSWGAEGPLVTMLGDGLLLLVELLTFGTSWLIAPEPLLSAGVILRGLWILVLVSVLGGLLLRPNGRIGTMAVAGSAVLALTRITVL